MNFKAVLRFVMCVFFLICFSFVGFAEPDEDYLERQIEASGTAELSEYLNDEQLEMLDTLGIDNVDFDAVFSPSPRRIFDLLYQVVRNEYASPFGSALSAAVMIIAVSLASQFTDGDGKISRIVEAFSTLCVALSIVIPLSGCLTRVISSIEMSADFMLALIPVLATVLTVSGNPTAALSYNSLSFAAAQAITQISSGFIRPVIQVTLSLSLMTGVCETVNLERLVAFVKKAVMFLMSLTSTLFITMLSIKGMLAASADTVAVRGVRFLIGNLIPVVGGAVSDAYLSITGTLAIVKNTAAVFGIAAVAVINLPVIIECVCWIFLLNLLSMMSDMFSQDKISSLLRSVSSAVTLLTVSLVFEVVVFVLSVGLVLLMKGSS